MQRSANRDKGAPVSDALCVSGLRVIGNAACAFDFHPLGVAEVGDRDEHDVLAFINRSLECSDPVIAPSNGLDIEEARDAIARKPTIELFDELLVFTAMTQEYPVTGCHHRIMLSRRSLRGVSPREPASDGLLSYLR